MNIRIKFQKYGVMKFIGHLDMMRYFQKAIRRAGIDIAYSGGYSPHQIMSFAAPLGVGITSEGEYFDIAVNSTKPSQESIDALNAAMAEGVSIVEYKKLPDTAKTSMSLVAAADYLIYVRPGYGPLFSSQEGLQGNIQEFYKGQAEILITKQTKKSQVEMDLKQSIYGMEAVGLAKPGQEDAIDSCVPVSDAIFLKDATGKRNFGHPCPSVSNALFLRVSTGSSNNLKPELVLETFCQFCGLEYSPFMFQIHRLEVYASSDEIPVKGEKEKKAYQNSLAQLKASYKKQGKPFPKFLPLGALGEDIL